MAVNTTFVDGTSVVNSSWLNWVNTVVNGLTGIGYLLSGAGTGGTVTQATNLNTNVTLNTYCGQITLATALGLPLGTGAQFLLNNNKVTLNDTVVLSIANMPSGTRPTLLLYPNIVSDGVVQICMVNVSTVGSLITAVPPNINFSIIKGVAS